MPSWQIGSVTIGLASDYGLGMSPEMAARSLDTWLPRYDRTSLRTLQEIVEALGDSYYVSGNDEEELREIIKRALHERKLVAVSIAGAMIFGGGSPTQTAAPPVARGPEPEPTKEKLSLRFRLLDRVTCKPITHAKVLIESEEGREEYLTDAAGEIFFLTTGRKRFSIVEIREPFWLRRIERTRG